MRIIKGNLWDSKDKLVLVTGNSYITKDGRLVMGRGAALELCNKFPGISYKFGKMIKYYSRHLGEYNLLIIDPYATAAEPILFTRYQLCGVFQVKYHFKEKADLELIKRSCDKLSERLEKYVPHIESVSMNFPGIGWGQRTMEEVLPIVEKLSDKVTLYVYENK